MGGLKTFLLALIWTTAPAIAGAEPLPPLVARLAACAGRLSAQMEFEWLMSDPAADRTETERAAMLDVLEAAMPAGRGPEVLARRIEAKQAQSALLTRATFTTDSASAAWARSRAQAEIGACTAMLLS